MPLGPISPRRRPVSLELGRIGTTYRLIFLKDLLPSIDGTDLHASAAPARYFSWAESILGQYQRV